jgi:hypothetical protein
MTIQIKDKEKEKRRIGRVDRKDKRTRIEEHIIYKVVHHNVPDQMCGPVRKHVNLVSRLYTD